MNIEVETQNFIIRETLFKDYEQFTEWENDSEIIRHMSFDEDRSYEDVVTEGIGNRNDPSKQDFTIVERKSGMPIGRIFVSRIDRHNDSLDITKLYIGDRTLWGKGIAKEVLREFLKYCFTFLHMERVTLDFYTGNKRAAALYDGLGFKPEGIARNAAKKNSQYHDLNIMSILRSEFFEEEI